MSINNLGDTLSFVTNYLLDDSFINLCLKTIDDVPAKLKDAVQAILDADV